MGSEPRWGVMLALVFLAACGTDKAGDSFGGDDGGDSGDIADCVVNDSLFAGMSVVEGGVPTVAVVEFTTAEASVTSVSWVDSYGDVHETADDAAATSHHFVLVGIQSAADIMLQAVADDGGVRSCSTPVGWTAGALGADLPVLTLTGDPIAQFTTSPLFTEDGNVLTVIDGHGAFVWTYAVPDQAWHTYFREDGTGLYFNRQAPTPNDIGAIATIDWEGNTTTLATWLGLHSDFVVLPEGGFAALVYDVRTMVAPNGAERVMVGDGIVEFDEKGVGRVIWSVFDSFVPNYDTAWPTVPGTSMEDWSHLNGLTYDEERAMFYIPMGAINGVIAVDRVDGSLAFSVSGEVGDIWLDEASTILNPHSVARVDGDSYVVFNRRAPTDDCSEVIWFDIDFSAGAATVSDSYSGTDCRTVTYLGQASPMADDGTLVVWTTSGILERIDAKGTPFWTVSSSIGGAFGYSDVTDNLYGAAE